MGIIFMIVFMEGVCSLYFKFIFIILVIVLCFNLLFIFSWILFIVNFVFFNVYNVVDLFILILVCKEVVILLINNLFCC